MMPLVPLAEVFEFIRNGMSVKQSKDAGGLPITRIETISDGSVDFDRMGYADLREEDAGKFILAPGDILLSHINSVEHIGKCALFEGSDTPVVHGMNLLAMRPKPNLVLPRFAMWAMKHPDFKNRILRFVNKAVNQASISTTNLKTVEIPLPPLEEQKRIAGILDQAAELCRVRTRALDKLNTLGQAIFHEMFGDPVTHATATLVDIVTKGDKINYGVVQPGDDVVEGIPLLRAGDILSPGLDPKGFRRVAAEVDAKHKKSRLKGDEILIACVGSIGSIALAHQGLKGVNIARAVARVPVDKKLANRVFIASQLKSQAVQNYFQREIRLVAQPTLNIKQITEAPIFLPSLASQEEFAARLSALDGNIGKAVFSLQRTEALFASLQHRAFLGEL